MVAARGHWVKKEPLMGLVALFGPIGLPEMLIILVIIMLIFGASRLPEIGKGIGQGIKNFKSGMKDE
ncbi:MAG TPA: twin-arginine translocase TatA/TatE family subunit [Vicinamibacterales bacterium]|nr:twin-arginine translocase TatA/TatE family subunit [Vicinamibacterales bacterium]